MNAKRSFLTLPLAIVATLLAAEGVNAASKSADEPNAIHSIVRGADGSATIISADGSSVSFTAKQIDALKNLILKLHSFLSETLTAFDRTEGPYVGDSIRNRLSRSS